MIVGRDRERAAIDSFVAGLGDGPRALRLEGEPGIGKTTLFRYAVGSIAGSGIESLVVRPAQPDADLSFAALADVIEPLFGAYEAALPGPQARAIRVALLAEESRRPADRRALSAGVLSILRARADAGAVLIAIDDVHWLDPDSATVIAFVLRRLGTEPISALVASRSPSLEGESRGLHRDLADALRRIEAQTVLVMPLDGQTIERVIEAQLGRSPPARELREIAERSGGNPFIALELARALERDDPRPTGYAVPIPKELRDDVARMRLDGLGSGTREMLEVASALARPTTSTIRAVVPEIATGEVFDEAVGAEILTIQGDHVRFVHPLYAAAIYAGRSRADRHHLHASIAAVVSDPQERGRHLALSTGIPDAAIADEVELAASHARALGAHDAAADLLDHAIRLSPPGDVRVRIRRLLAASDERTRTGEPTAAAAHAAAAADLAEPGPTRAQALARLGSLSAAAGDLSAARDTLRSALEEPGIEVATRSKAHADLSRIERDLGDHKAAGAEADAALGLVTPDVELEVAATGIGAALEDALWSGRGDGRDLLDRDARVWEPIVSMPVDRWPRIRLAELRMLEGNLGGARDLLEGCLAAAGDEPAPGLLLSLAMLERLSGRFVEALGYAQDAVRLVAESGVPAVELGALAWLEAQVGRFDDAANHASEAIALAGARSVAGAMRGYEALAAVELANGRPEDAAPRAELCMKAARAVGIGEPAYGPGSADAIEAMIAGHRVDEAASIVRNIERSARGRTRPYAKAIAQRGKGLVAAAAGDLVAGERALSHAASREVTDAVGPYERGRTLLGLGSVLRRIGKRSEAVSALDEAADLFGGIDAEPWVARATQERGRIGGRRRAIGLTDAERRVAKLVAAGRTDKEIAETLSLAVRTVEGHVGHILRKFGLRNRREIGIFLDDLLDAGESREAHENDGRSDA